MEERERVRRDSSDEEEEVPIGGSRRATITSHSDSVDDSERLRMDSVGEALPAGQPRTARLSSGEYGSSDDDDESSGDDEDLHFKLDV